MSAGVKPGRYFVQGDEAIAEGAIAAGCRFFAGYPITPSSETSETMARRLPEVGGSACRWKTNSPPFTPWEEPRSGAEGHDHLFRAGNQPETGRAGMGDQERNPLRGRRHPAGGPQQRGRHPRRPGDLYTVRYGSAGGNCSIIALSPKSTQEPLT